MGKLLIAFLWHHHQPYYKDDSTGEIKLPWVRLHGIKDYYGMAKILEEFPEIKATFNLVPSLLVQLLAYARDKVRDRFNELLYKKIEDLDSSEKGQLLERAFLANWQRMVKPYPRYRDLLLKRGKWGPGSPPRDSELEARIARFSDQELLDLEVWSDLAWFHPTILEQNDFLRTLKEKGRNFTEEEKQALLDREYEYIAQVIPLHKRLQERGQIEITTSPFYHPILPLLCDFQSAREALPWLQFPKNPVSLRADAESQLDRGLELFESLFGSRPCGMWPSEGSVSSDIVPLLAERGIRWIATDEEILEQTLKVKIQRNESGEVLNPEVLYRPYRVTIRDTEIDILFRDHYISDLIGFQYHRLPLDEAVSDFLGRMKRIRDRVGREDLLLSIILDGENAWEQYEGGGVPFLRALYAGLRDLEGVETVLPGRYLPDHPPLRRLSRLFPGSWINHNFFIWIGHPEDQKGWNYLLDARDALLIKEKEGTLPPSVLHRAWEELYIAEGSDWYWWFGDDHCSGNDEEFDVLFRRHLGNIYDLIQTARPDHLQEPIIGAPEELFEPPQAFLRVSLDGRKTSFFEWFPAGHYSPRQEASTMEKAFSRLGKDIYFGFDENNFYLRIDFEEKIATIFEENYTVAIHFLKPLKRKVVVAGPGELLLYTPGEETPKQFESVAAVEILELGLPFEALGFKVHDDVAFYIEILQAGESLERSPSARLLSFQVPSDDFEYRQWSAL
jgi:alpha-amylase/alpha-mannosidase (GH57 family)